MESEQMTNTKIAELSDEKVAGIVFKSLGLVFEENVNNDDLSILEGDKLLSVYNICISREWIINDFIYSWPYPNVLGLIIESAKEMGWKPQWDINAPYDLFAFVKPRKHLDQDHPYETIAFITKFYEIKTDNPMQAVCKAYVEVLDKEGKI